MKRFIALLLMTFGGAVGRTAPAELSATPLSDLFKPGILLQDRNGDGVVDFVDARLVLPEQPSSGELAVASDIAARLGFETSAMSLPVTVARGFSASAGPGTSTIFVGAKSLAGSGVTLDAIGAGGLTAGEGAVVAFRLGAKIAVAVLGGDDSGLASAGVMIAGHLPYVRDQKGPTTDKIADDVKQFIATKGIMAASSTAAAVRTRAATPDAADRLVVVLQMASGGDLVKALAALNQFKATGGRSPKRPLSYPSVRVLQIRLRAPGAAIASVDLPRGVAPERAAAQPLPRRPGGGAKENFDLSTFYAIEGALGDSDNNLIPDRVDVLLSAEGEGSEGMIDLAARLGLESTGISLPIAETAKSLTAPASEPILVLIGISHPVVDQLIKDHKWERPPLQAGDGLIQLVKKAFGEKSALIVTGGDAAGVRRAVRQLAETFPHIWQRGKDRTTLDDVEEDVRRFVAGRSPAGQAAMSLYKLDKLAGQLKGKELASAHVRVFVEKAADGFVELARKRAAETLAAASLTVEVQDLDVQKGRALISDEFEIPSEVDEFWSKLRARVSTNVKKKSAVVVEARLLLDPAPNRAAGARRTDQGRRRRKDDDGLGAVRLQAGLQLALRCRAPGTRRQGDRSDYDQVCRDRSASRLEAAGDVRAHALAARNLSD